MPRSTPSSLPAAYWMERSPREATVPVEHRPTSGKPASRTPGFILVNDLALARQSAAIATADQALLLDVRELFALAIPLSPAEEVPRILGLLAGDEQPRSGAQALAESWPFLEARFRAWPEALLEIVVQLLSTASPAWQAFTARLAAGSSLTLSAETLPATAALMALLPRTQEKVARRELPDPEEYDPLDPGDVARWLEPGGPCETQVEGYEHREGQVHMARAVAEAFNGRKHLLVEAGTGVGKSVAYLLPSILWSLRNRLPVVISTNTRNLQTQLFQKDIPLLRHVLSHPFRAALIKGRMNYVCVRHLLHLLEHRENELAEEDVVPMAKVAAWLLHTTSGDLEELDRVSAGGAASLIARLPATGEECGGRSCRHYARCLLQRARIQSLNADLVVANHALVFSETGPIPSAIPRHAHVVFDEAHNLEESATRHFTVELSPLRFAIALRRLWRGGRRRKNGGLLEDLRGLLHTQALPFPDSVIDTLFETIAEAIQAIDRVRQSSRDFFRALASIPRPGEAPLRFRSQDLNTTRWKRIEDPRDELRDALTVLHETLERLLSTLDPDGSEEEPARPSVADALRDLRAALAGVGELATQLEFVLEAKDDDFVYWLDVLPREREPAGQLSAAPIEIAGLLEDQVFRIRESIVFCSATLSVNGSFQFLAHRIGLDRIEPGKLLTCQACSPFDYASQCKVSAAAFLPDPADTGGNPYPSALADFLVLLLQRTRGRTLVLFTSYEMMRTCARHLALPLLQAGITLLVQGEGGSRDRLTRTFRQDISSVLLGTDSFWEGVDVMGESLSCVVIARLPFDAVKDPLVSARGERVAQAGGDPFRHFALPNAIIKFRQGFGRLIRHRDDRGLIVVTDRRVFSKSYGVYFRRNLPCPIRSFPDAGTLLDESGAFLGTQTAQPELSGEP